MQTNETTLTEGTQQKFDYSVGFLYFSEERGFSAMAQNPELMAAIGKSFANQQLTMSKMVEPEDEEEVMTVECSSCNLVQTEENISYSDNTCPHCGSTMYRSNN